MSIRPGPGPGLSEDAIENVEDVLCIIKVHV